MAELFGAWVVYMLGALIVVGAGWLLIRFTNK